MRAQRFIAFTIALLALVGTTTGIVLAATDANAGSQDPLAVHGLPPTTAVLNYQISEGPKSSVSGQLQIDFRHSAIAGYVDVPFVIFTTQFQFVEKNGSLYFNNSTPGATESWLRLRAPSLDLTGLSLEALRPEFRLLRTMTLTSITHRGSLTTRHYRQARSKSLALGKLPLRASALMLDVTTGLEGQFAGATLRSELPSAVFRVDANVESYNRPLHITAPPASSTHDYTVPNLLKLFNGNDAFSTLLKLGTVAVPSATGRLGI